MKANELRVYNYIYKKIHKKDTPLEVVEVLSIDGSFDVLDVKNIGGYITEQCPLKDFEPIPLTEEWLLNFGFIYSRPGIGGQDQWTGFGNWYLTNDNYFSMVGTKNGECWFNRVEDWKIQYVHQLQGLYFYLTGKELTIKQD